MSHDGATPNGFVLCSHHAVVAPTAVPQNQEMVPVNEIPSDPDDPQAQTRNNAPYDPEQVQLPLLVPTKTRPEQMGAPETATPDSRT